MTRRRTGSWPGHWASPSSGGWSRRAPAWPYSTTTAGEYLADDFRNGLALPGIRSSPSFLRESEGNGCARRFIRTLNENVLWVRR